MRRDRCWLVVLVAVWAQVVPLAAGAIALRKLGRL